jgi:competence protein ComEA
MRELTFDRRRAAVAGAVVLCMLVLASKLLLHPAAPAVPPPVRVAGAVAARAPAAPLFVNVVGAVRRPGLYRLKEGARVADAVTRAGGPTTKAQIELVNLAARIADGEQIVVPRRGLGAPIGTARATVGTAATGPVHLNSATLEQLDALPGVGPVTAQKILDYRQKHGSFGSVDELDAISGIGPARLGTLRDLVAP